MDRAEPPAVSCCNVWVRVRRSEIRLVGGVGGVSGCGRGREGVVGCGWGIVVEDEWRKDEGRVEVVG